MTYNVHTILNIAVGFSTQVCHYITTKKDCESDIVLADHLEKRNKWLCGCLCLLR